MSTDAIVLLKEDHKEIRRLFREFENAGERAKATKGRLVRALLEDGTAPRTPAGLADHLGSLGWKVEVGPSTAKGTALDVVVTEV